MSSNIIEKVIESCQSTQEELKKILSSSDSGSFIVSKQQTQGRGRYDRNWESLDGNFMGSFLFKSDTVAIDSTLSMRVGYGLLQYLNSMYKEKSLDSSLVLKWPNDLLKRTSRGLLKVAGVLIELEQKGTEVTAIVGIGLNLTRSPLVENIKTGDVSELNLSTDSESLKKIAQDIRENIQESLNTEFFIDLYQGFHVFKPGDFIKWTASDQSSQGFFESFNVDGSLSVRVNDRLQALYAEEVLLNLIE